MSHYASDVNTNFLVLAYFVLPARKAAQYVTLEPFAIGVASDAIPTKNAFRYVPHIGVKIRGIHDVLTLSVAHCHTLTDTICTH